MRVQGSLAVASVLVLSLAFGCSASSDGASKTSAGSGSSGTPGAPGTSPAGSPTRSPHVASAKSIPLVAPPVRAAIPAGLGGSSKSFSKGAPTSLLDANDMKSRFFTEGPTSVFRLLALIDGGITEINGQIARGDAPCLAAEAVSYDLTPFGASVPFFAQCSTSKGTGFSQFGQKNGSTYLYSLAGAGPVAVQITPIGSEGAADAGAEGGSDGGTAGYSVHAWLSITDGKTTGGSYGVIEFLANSSTHSFELTVAGRGFGYCGAQLRSDGANVYEIGSSDMGATCNEPAAACVSASDVLLPGTCGPLVEKFALGALGRLASAGATGALGASGYPGEALNAVLLDGSAADSTMFGPTAPTAGVLDLGH